MIQKAILLATSKGNGFGNLDVPAPLVEVGGVPLVKRSLIALEQQGIHDICVVVGYRGEEVRRYVSSDSEVTANLTWMEDPDSESCDARSLARAGRCLAGPVLVLGTQILFAPDLLAPLLQARRLPGEATLLVDHKISMIYDLGGATKVRCRADRVVAMSQDLADFDAVSLGIAMVSPAFLRSLAGGRMGGQSFAGLLGRCVHSGHVVGQDINGGQWQEITSPETRLHAEWLVRAYGEDLSGQAPLTVPARSTPGDPERTLSYIEGLLSEKNARHYILFNPGPVLTSPRVKSALVHHDVCHRDTDYSMVLRRLQHKLRRVCRGGPEHDVVLLSGSGTAAMESVISSCVPPEGKLLVVSNGAFGERFAEIARVHQIRTVHLRVPWGEVIDPRQIERTLDAVPGVVAVIVCHHETSVGILNPVQQIGALCRSRNVLFFVDAVSSLAGEDLDVRRDSIDILISSANKCLHAISGVSFVCVDSRVWPRIEGIRPRVLYLDLKRYYRYSKELSQTPFTPAVSSFFALDTALDELLKQGVDSRIRHYRALNERIREALRQMGLSFFSETGFESHSITTVQVPPYIEFADLYEEMKRRGYIVYACKDRLKDRFFQIANMGELSDEMVQGFLDTLDQVLSRAAEQSRKVIHLARLASA